jgi:spoIIIJ-associated protein
MNSAEGRGRTIDEAVDAALVQLGKSRRDVDVKVLSEDADETVVEVTVLKAVPDDANGGGAAAPSPTAGSGPAPAGAAGSAGSATAEQVKSLVAELLERMGIRCQVSARESEESITVDVSGRDLGMLIGWRGETLRALQTMTNLLASKHLGPERRVIVDVEKYRQRRENTVREIAFRAARQVKMTGDPITLDAMQPFERRAIHMALAEDPEVATGSIGEEPERRVVVSPSAGGDA